MILFFPQYQSGEVPSRIPVGTPDLRALWKDAPGFHEVPLQTTDDYNPETEGGIRFRRILTKQMLDAREIVEIAKPDFILTTGGDCGASFASIDYTNRLHGGKVGVIWVDAHGDIHTPETSPSGNYHGMILRNLLGEGSFDVQPVKPLERTQFAYLGLRDTEAEEDKVIAEYAIPRFSAEEVMAGNAPADAVVAHFKKHGMTHLYLHVDCDVMDQDVFPHVHVLEPNGLSLERLLELLQYLRSQMPVAGCCLTEYAPAEQGAGLDILKRIYTEGLGQTLPT